MWVVENRIWAPKVPIIGKGINFMVEDPTTLFGNLHKANAIASRGASSIRDQMDWRHWGL